MIQRCPFSQLIVRSRTDEAATDKAGREIQKRDQVSRALGTEEANKELTDPGSAVTPPLATTAGPSSCFFRSSCLSSAGMGESVSGTHIFFERRRKHPQLNENNDQLDYFGLKSLSLADDAALSSAGGCAFLTHLSNHATISQSVCSVDSRAR